MKISREKREKISEQIILLLFQKTPQLIFTSHIAREIARDEEFVREILEDLKLKGLVVDISKNKEGKDYLKRRRWKLSSSAYLIYKNAQAR